MGAASAGHGQDGSAVPETITVAKSRSSLLRLRLCSLASMFGSALSARTPTSRPKCAGTSRARLRRACAQNVALPGPFVAQSSATEWIDDPCTHTKADLADAECRSCAERRSEQRRGEEEEIKFSFCCCVWSSGSVEFSGSLCLLGCAACLHRCAEAGW